MTDYLNNDDDLQQAINNSLQDLNLNDNLNDTQLTFEEQMDLATNLSFQDNFDSNYNSSHNTKISEKSKEDPIPFKTFKTFLPVVTDIANNVFPYFKILYPCCNNYYYNIIEHDINENHEANTKVE